jgi:hypothetical protein
MSEIENDQPQQEVEAAIIEPVYSVSDIPVETSPDILALNSSEMLALETPLLDQDDNEVLIVEDDSIASIAQEKVAQDEENEVVKMPQPISISSKFTVRVPDESQTTGEDQSPHSPVVQTRSRQHSLSTRAIKKIQFSAQLENIGKASANDDSLTPSFAKRHDGQHEGQLSQKTPDSSSAVKKIDMTLPKKSTDYTKLDWALAKGILSFPYFRFARQT